jgi:hypothetical protein
MSDVAAAVAVSDPKKPLRVELVISPFGSDLIIYRAGTVRVGHAAAAEARNFLNKLE